jgi:hypothetical protein
VLVAPHHRDLEAANVGQPGAGERLQHRRVLRARLHDRRDEGAFAWLRAAAALHSRGCGRSQRKHARNRDAYAARQQRRRACASASGKPKVGSGGRLRAITNSTRSTSNKASSRAPQSVHSCRPRRATWLWPPSATLTTEERRACSRGSSLRSGARSSASPGTSSGGSCSLRRPPCALDGVPLMVTDCRGTRGARAAQAASLGRVQRWRMALTPAACCAGACPLRCRLAPAESGKGWRVTVPAPVARTKLVPFATDAYGATRAGERQCAGARRCSETQAEVNKRHQPCCTCAALASPRHARACRATTPATASHGGRARQRRRIAACRCKGVTIAAALKTCPR